MIGSSRLWTQRWKFMRRVKLLGGLGLKLTRNLTMLPARFEKIVVIFDIGTLATQQRGMIRIRKSKFFFLWTRERGKEGYRFLGVWGHFSWKTSTCQEYTYTKRKRNLLRSQHFQSQNKWCPVLVYFFFHFLIFRKQRTFAEPGLQNFLSKTTR